MDKELKKTKTKAKVVAPIILEKGALAIWVSEGDVYYIYEGRYSTDETTVRIRDYNCFDEQYLVEIPEDGRWELVHRDDIKPIKCSEG